MRIQNNVTAMNTHRMYTMNNDAVAASAKKLSSGYRINSAADDAAGLAISEKMRSQIRGLNMATKNSQDAISLVQTAEGALQETQNMLQRMNELAVQAATGTNEDLDRTALAKEFEQLKREINDVAAQTNFNNMKILDGSLSYDGYKRSTLVAGITATTESISGVDAKDPITKLSGIEGNASATPADAGTAASIKITGGDGVLATDKAAVQALGYATSGSPAAKDGSDVNYKVAITAKNTDGEDVSFEIAIKGEDIVTDDNSLAQQIADAITGDSTATPAVKPALGEGYKASVDAAGNLVIEEATNGKGNIDLASIKMSVTATVDGGDELVNSAAATPTTDVALTEATSATGTQTLTTTAANSKPRLDVAGVEGVEYTLDINDGTNKIGSVTVKSDGQTKLGQLLADKGTVTLTKTDGTTAEYNITWDSNTGALGLSGITTSDRVTAANISLSLTRGEQTIENNPIVDPDTLIEGVAATDNADSVGASAVYGINFPKAGEEDSSALRNNATVTIDGVEYTFKANPDEADAAKNYFSSGEELAKLVNSKAKLDETTGLAKPDSDGKYTGGNVTAKWDADKGQMTISAVQLSAANPNATADANGNKYNETNVSKFATQDVSMTWADPSKGGAGTKTTLEFDFAKLNVGDEISINVGGKDLGTVKVADGMTRKDFMDAIDAKVKELGDDRVKVSGNALIASGIEASATLSFDSLEKAESNALRIQVGALENEQLSISIDAMTTKGLNIDDAALTKVGNTNDQNIDLAGKAITAVRDAINKVSDQRATLGAMQNRLDHKIANLKTTAENLTASESRIRDVDMAQEMTNFTKNNILSQAATAMLAQANSLPQNVLSLLG